MQTDKSSQPRYPAYRAFVVQVAMAEPGELAVPFGRVEHVVSGTATHFASWNEFVVFVTQVLAAEEQSRDTSRAEGCRPGRGPDVGCEA